MSNWDEAALGQLVSEGGGEIKTGPFGSQLHEADYVDDPTAIPVVMPTDMSSGRINYSTVARIDEDKAAELKQHLVKKGDVLLPRRGDLGRHVLIRDSDVGAFCGTGSLRIRLGSSRLLPEFLAYFFSTGLGRQQLEAKASGVTMPNISTSSVREVSVRFPEPDLQLAIVSVISAYEELIQHNMRRIEILEAMAQVAFQEWFVHFRGELTLVNSEIGHIPDGWRVGLLSELVDVDPSTPRASKDENSFVPMSSLVAHSMLVSEIQRRTADAGLSRFINGDTLFPGINPSLQNGKTAFVGFLNKSEVGLGSTEFIVLRSKQDAPEWVYCLARTNRLREAAIKSMTGASGRQRVKKDTLRNFVLPIPPDSIIKNFSDLFAPSFRFVENLRRQNEALRTARDVLLPRLVSGEVDLSHLDIDTSWLAA